jgi:hypothetical protein
MVLIAYAISCLAHPYKMDKSMQTHTSQHFFVFFFFAATLQAFIAAAPTFGTDHSHTTGGKPFSHAT